VSVVAALSTLGAEGKRPEKLLIAAYVVGAKQLYIAVKAGFARELAALRPPLDEMRQVCVVGTLWSA
jgi:NADH:ubiquinone oxidoreductase subunit F (NADH-binding)